MTKTAAVSSPGTWWARLGNADGERAYRLAVAARVLAATAGGYALTSLLTGVLGLLLPGPRAEAVLTATMLSFAALAAIVMWCFAASSARRVWAVLLTAIAICSAALWALRHAQA